MTKAAIAHLTKCLAVEWGKYNITVNAVAPTFIRTPGTEPALADPAFHTDVNRTHRGVAPYRRTGGCRRGGGISCFAGRVYHYRTYRAD
jgi:NAD(P)-dependent dehydrogenase (short-subunit alcohol dehydrogenase family)